MSHSKESTSEIIYPSWLDKEYLRTVLHKEIGNGVLREVSIHPANKKGENYSSIMLRVRIEVESYNKLPKIYKLIVKLNPVGLTHDIMIQFNVFPKEIEMYTNILPALEQLFKDIGEECQFSPRCLKACPEPGNIIILEDLCEKGFRTADRQLGLDLEHAILALRLLAKYHAASAVYYEKVKDFSDHFRYGLHAEHMKPILYAMYEKNIDMMREISSKWTCSNSMHRFLDNYKTKMLDRVFELQEDFRQSDRFQVLCHGDFWCNNVMFKYESGSPTYCLLLDFQLANFNSPAFDLNYFIFTSMRKELKLTQMDTLIHYYHSQLVDHLQRLNYSGQVISLLELHRDFHDLGAYGLNSTYGTLCAVVAPSDGDMSNLWGDDEESQSFRRKLFSNPLYVDALEQLIPYFERKGIF